MSHRFADLAAGLSRSAVAIAAFAAGVALLGPFAASAHAQISFQSGTYAASVGLGQPQSQSYSTTEYGPNSVAVVVPPNSSTTTADYEASGFTYGFNQVMQDPDATSGSAEGTFTAAAGTTYSITDPDPVEEGTDYDWVSTDAYLEDVTTDTYLYDSSMGGSLTGTLLAGQTYEFGAGASMQTETDPTLGYVPSIAFAAGAPSPTPEPSSLMLLGTGVLGAAGALRRRMRRG